MEITKGEISDLENVRVFYKKCNYDGGAKKEDYVFLAKVDNKLVGAARLCPEMNVLVLRGMQVLPEFQGQGIGKKILKSCNSYLAKQSCYCIPQKYLRSFYEQIGFKLISPTKLPIFLNQRLELYIAKNMNVIPMYRPGKSANN